MGVESGRTGFFRPGRADPAAVAYAIMGCLAAILFLGGVALLPRQQAITTRAVEHSLEVVADAQRLLADCALATGTQRRVLLDGTGEHIPRFAMRKQVIDQDLVALRAMVADDPHQSTALADLAEAVRQRIALLQTTVDMVLRGQVATALALDQLYRTDPRTMAVQTKIEAFLATESGLLRQRLAGAQAASLSAALALTACVVVLIATVIAAALLLLRRRAERAHAAALSASEAEMRATFDQAGVGIAHVAPDGQWLRVNARLCRMLRYSEAELRERTFQDLTHPDDLEADLEQVRAMLAGTLGTYTMEKRYFTRDGRTVWGNLTVVLMRDAAGEPSHFISVVEDISDRKEAEAAAREYYEDFRMLSDNMPSLCWMARPDGHIYWYNQRWYEYTGTEAAAQEGWQWQSVHDPEVLPDVLARWRESIATGQPFEMTFPLRAADGSFRPFLTRIMPLRGKSGTVQRWFGINVDVSAQQASERTLQRLVADRTAALAASEAQLRQSEMHYRLLAEHSTDTVSRVAADGTRVYTSPAGERLFGVPSEVLHAQGLLSVVHPEDQERAAVLQRALLSGSAEAETITFRIDNPARGEVWVESNARAIRDPQTGAQDGYIAVLRDITERRRLESALQHGQKMEAIGRIAAGVAHDFNNILQSVITGLELSIEDLPANVPGAQFIRVALGAARRGATLTSQLLSYARKQMLHPRAIDAAAFLQELAQLLSRTLGPDVALVLQPLEALPPMLADAGQLQTALLNLAVNARHAMPAGGTLTLGARAVRGGEAVALSVRDTGTGMDAETLRRACEPFFSTKGMEGTGLGLSMVQGFAEQSGGHLRIASLPGQGTTVAIELPVAPPEISKGAAATAPAGFAGGLRILLVDDEPDVLITTGAFLERSGMTVLRAATGDQALALVGRGDAIDVLVTDYAMPGLNGADLIVEARAIQPTLAALVISGFAEVGASDTLPSTIRVLYKPYPREALAMEIQRALNMVGARHRSTTLAG